MSARFVFNFYLVCLLLIAPAGFGQSILVDPGIPDGERITYALLVDKIPSTMTQVTVRKNSNGREWYEVSSLSDREDLRVAIDRKSMAVEYSWARRKKADFVMETETKILKNEIKAKPDEIVVADFAGLLHLLRGFPFDKLRSLRLKTAQGGDFAFIVTVTREVELKTRAGVIPCYEVELGLEGFFGAFMPKTKFWFSREAPHYLARYEGLTAGPGSPALLLEIAEYQGK